MYINIKVTGSIEKVMQSIDAERKKTETATIRALNKTAQWLRSEGIKRVSEERKIPRKALKNKIIILKANKKRLWCRVRLISDLAGVAKLGSIKQTKRGAKVGSTLYEGAFIAVMKNGHVGIFRRRCMDSLPIDEEKVKSHAKEIPAIQTCEVYPAERREIIAPAVFVELVSLEPGKGSGNR